MAEPIPKTSRERRLAAEQRADRHAPNSAHSRRWDAALGHLWPSLRDDDVVCTALWAIGDGDLPAFRRTVRELNARRLWRDLDALWRLWYEVDSADC
jgi:hypothetical protein